MRNLLLVAKREYLEQIRGRAFRITTILVPALFAGIFFVAILSGRNSGVGKHVVIAAPSAELANAVRDEMMKDKDAKTTVDVVAPAAPADRDALVQRVQSKAVDGMLWIETSGGSTKATYTSQSSGDIVVTSRLAGALNHAIAMQRMTARGMSPAEVEALLKDVSVDTLQLDKQGKEVKSSGMISYLKGYIMALMLSMTTMIYGMNVARSIIQEKTSRIFEVMLAAAKPSDLLAGKLIGVGAVGLTQIAIWVLAGAAIVSAVASRAMMSGQITVHFSWVEAVLFGIYFVLGYLLYASLFAGLASSCETEQELQMYTPLAALPIWLSFSLIWLVINDPNSIWSIGASLFPATAPIIMMLRMGSEMPPPWQVGASIALMVLSVWLVLWISSRLYRVGILMYGKRATLPELVRWLRYS